MDLCKKARRWESTVSGKSVDHAATGGHDADTGELDLWLASQMALSRSRFQNSDKIQTAGTYKQADQGKYEQANRARLVASRIIKDL